MILPGASDKLVYPAMLVPKTPDLPILNSERCPSPTIPTAFNKLLDSTMILPETPIILPGASDKLVAPIYTLNQAACSIASTLDSKACSSLFTISANLDHNHDSVFSETLVLEKPQCSSGKLSNSSLELAPKNIQNIYVDWDIEDTLSSVDQSNMSHDIEWLNNEATCVSADPMLSCQKTNLYKDYIVTVQEVEIMLHQII